MNNSPNVSPEYTPVIPFDSLAVCAVVHELNRLLVGGQVQEVRQPSALDVQFAIYSQGESHLLQFCLDARYARLHLTGKRLPNPPTPFGFCSALRKHLNGGKVLTIQQLNRDRIVEITIQNSGDDGVPREYRLLAEIMGKHSNLVLSDAAGRIIDAAKRVSRRINRQRETLPGLKYELPPSCAVPEIMDDETFHEVVSDSSQTGITRGCRLTALLRRSAPYISPFLAFEIALRLVQSNQVSPSSSSLVHDPIWDDLLASYEPSGHRISIVLDGLFEAVTFNPVLITGGTGASAYPVRLLQVPADSQSPVISFNEALANGYVRTLREARLKDTSDHLESEIHKEIVRSSKVATALRHTINERDRAETYTQSGELVLANLWRIDRGHQEVTVIDYYSSLQEERTIRLDPKLSPHENAQHFFDLARRAREAVVNAESRVNEATEAYEKACNALEALHTLRVAAGVEWYNVEELRGRLYQEGTLRPPRASSRSEESEFQGHRIRRVITAEGYEILVGESSTANDYLTTRIARANDLWLHVRSATSAHVVVLSHSKPGVVPMSVVRQAAILCARHSAQKHASLVAVDYTLKKYVRKPRKAPAGSVVLEREKTIEVTP